MIPEGFREYERREYCRDIRCPVQLLLEKQDRGTDAYQEIRQICMDSCIHSTYEFHHWLIEKGFLVVKPEKEND
jgi:hypothetical protein